MSKIVFKPLDVMRKRLYRVMVTWPNGMRDHKLSFADAPRLAAESVRRLYSEIPMEEQPHCLGTAINIGQPAEWFDDNRKSPLDCKHERNDLIQSTRGSSEDHSVYICPDCGEISVQVFRGPKIRFGIACDDHLRAAAKYMRSELESQEALDRAKQGPTPTSAPS